MSQFDDGGAAFPVPGDQQYPQLNGMSLRDWFAGQALTKLLANPGAEGVFGELDNASAHASRAAYAIADAMLAARKSTGEQR